MTFAALASYRSTTTKVMTPVGALYVVIMRDDDGHLVRLMAHCGKESTGGRWCGDDKAERVSHPQINSLLDTVTHLAHRLIECGESEIDVIKKLMGYDEGWPITYTFPAGSHGPEHRIKSLQDAIGHVLLHDIKRRIK